MVPCSGQFYASYLSRLCILPQLKHNGHILLCEDKEVESELPTERDEGREDTTVACICL